MAGFLVTGGAGFIGSNLVETLLKSGNVVRVLDDFSSGRPCNLSLAAEWAAAGGGDFTLIEGDIRDPETCRRAVSDVEYVLHKAAVASVQQSVRDPRGTDAVNVGGTLNLLEAARQAGVKRFVFACSAAVYGAGEELPKVESMSPDPISPYGLQKLAGEGYCGLYHRLYGLPTVSLRYFNVFGPRQDPASEYAAVVPKFIDAARAGRQVTVYGDGEQTRDFLFVDNVVRANLLACEAGPGAWGRGFNIAGGKSSSLNELLALLGRLLGREIATRYAEPRPGDIRHSVAGIERAAARLGYRPEIGLSAGLKRTLDAV